MEIFRRISSFFLDAIETIVVASSLFVLVYLFLAQPHEVVGNSMLPNFHNKEYIVTDKISYCLGQPKRGEVIVFTSTEDKDKDFIKRVIGLPGERVRISGEKVFINGSQLRETYLDSQVQTPPGRFIGENQEVVVAQNQFVVLGDNRLNSSDSRTWGFIKGGKKCGFLGDSGIIGKALLVYWPIDRLRIIKSANYR